MWCMPKTWILMKACFVRLYYGKHEQSATKTMTKAETINWQTQVKVQGLKWPLTLGPYKLMGPVNNLGAWRWYERQFEEGMTQRIKVNHLLKAIDLKAFCEDSF